MEIKHLENVLSELKVELNADIMLCPELLQSQLTTTGSGSGYKLCRKGENPRRILFLILDQYSFDYGEAKTKVRSAILQFWYGVNIDRTMVETIIY